MRYLYSLIVIVAMAGCASVPDKGFTAVGVNDVSMVRVDQLSDRLGDYLRRLVDQQKESELRVFISVGAITTNEYNRDADTRSIEDRFAGAIFEGNRYALQNFPDILSKTAYHDYLRGRLGDGYLDAELWLAIIVYFNTHYETIQLLL